MPNPHKPHPHDKPHPPIDKTTRLAADLAISAVQVRAFDHFKTPIELADYCIDVAKRVIDRPIDGDVDKE